MDAWAGFWLGAGFVLGCVVLASSWEYVASLRWGSKDEES